MNIVSVLDGVDILLSAEHIIAAFIATLTAGNIIRSVYFNIASDLGVVRRAGHDGKRRCTL